VNAEAVELADGIERLAASLADEILGGRALVPDTGDNPSRNWAALEAFSRAYAIYRDDGKLGDAEREMGRALEADPRFVSALVGMAAIYGSRGKLEEAATVVQQALEKNPAASGGWLILGMASAMKQDLPNAHKALAEARRRDPDDADAAQLEATLYLAEDKVGLAEKCLLDAVRINRFSAETQARLGELYAHQRDKERALSALQAAEKLGSDDLNAEAAMATGFDLIGQSAAALAHYERALEMARKIGASPEVVGSLKSARDRIKGSMMPARLPLPHPKRYSEAEVDKELAKLLTPDEIKRVVRPLADNAAMRDWAKSLVAGKSKELDKAQALFDGLSRRIILQNPENTRTAADVFAVWKNTDLDFNCQEYAKLYTALARAVGLDAYYVHVEQDFEATPVGHACASVFIDGKAILVDPLYRWFGVPHKRALVLDDVNVIAHQMLQTGEGEEGIANARIGETIDPQYAWAHVRLGFLQINAGKWEEAEAEARKAEALDPRRADCSYLWGAIEAHRGEADKALVHLRAALQYKQMTSRIRYGIAQVLKYQGKLQEACDEYKRALSASSNDEFANLLRKEIVDIQARMATVR
jgi:tetratricopeptide (TPR) repeat protein